MCSGVLTLNQFVNMKMYYCGYCFRRARKNEIFCDVHCGLWNTLEEKTKKQVEEKLNEKKLCNRRIQIFINKVMILDELNKKFT